MKKKIAIIGANESINHLIITAKAKGYETHVFAWKSGDIGEENADFFYPISIDDKEAILKKCQEIKPDGVASITSDFAVNTVNYVARNLNLRCNSEKTDSVARNKYMMRCALKQAGLFTPWFIKVSDFASLDLSTLPNFPLIVKPTDRWSSKGVSCARNIEELKKAVEYATKESLCGDAIIEEFMEGPEYSCECISFDGNHRILAFTQKITTGFPHYIETGHNQPSNIEESVIKDFSPLILKALNAMDIKNGASHVEFRILDGNKLGIIEIGARMGGDNIGTDLVKLSTGMDFVGMVADIACNTAPDFTVFYQPKKARVRFILTETDMQKLEDIKRENPSSIVRISEIEPIGTREVTDSSTRFGYYIYTE
ncbi:MAG: ATP-grasp domain-containing protein [Ruminococcaceae bacterium]|nr:ATP-grasp domain-containing protein [Oscillospiraceae bacterium]